MIDSGPILFDGGMGTELYKRGVYINKCFDELNLTNPALVASVHESYVAAGADIIETNTFGANPQKLERYSLASECEKINTEGVRIAKSVARGGVLVAGSVGPLGIKIEPLGPTSRREAHDFFAVQIKALAESGADLIILETFVYPDELRQALAAARSVCDLPVIAQMTIDENCNSLTGASPETMIAELDALGADAIGINCTVGPQVMFEWLERVRRLSSLPISLMPNAGRPRNVDGRNIYMSSPEYFAEYAKRFIQAGANIIGGCCGTSPEHIRAMRAAIHSLKPRKTYIETKASSEPSQEREKPTSENKSRFARRLHDGHFVTSVEIVSPFGADAKKEIENAREMYNFGIDAINIPDGPRASARMSGLAMAVLIRREVGIEPIMHYVCRDRNVIEMQSGLVGAYALGVRNILAITGDPPKLGNYPDATAVFDVDSIGLMNIIYMLNNGRDIAGNPIGAPTGFFAGVGANPGAINLDEELRRLDWKIKAGAEFIITQPVFDVSVFEHFVNLVAHYRVPILAGVWPLVSIRNAEFMNNEMPGCSVPESILRRMALHEGNKEAGIAEGIRIARETIEQIRPMVNGLQISAPFGRVRLVEEILG